MTSIKFPRHEARMDISIIFAAGVDGAYFLKIHTGQVTQFFRVLLWSHAGCNPFRGEAACYFNSGFRKGGEEAFCKFVNRVKKSRRL